jgi:hypothetical protein
VFRNGRSHAVRIPAEYRFKTEEVFIQRDAKTGAIILTEKRRDPRRKRSSGSLMRLARANSNWPVIDRRRLIGTGCERLQVVSAGLRGHLRKGGKSLSTADLMIAAHAIAEGAVLVWPDKAFFCALRHRS